MYILAFEEIFDSASDNVLIFDLEHTFYILVYIHVEFTFYGMTFIP